MSQKQKPAKPLPTPSKPGPPANQGALQKSEAKKDVSRPLKGKAEAERSDKAKDVDTVDDVQAILDATRRLQKNMSHKKPTTSPEKASSAQNAQAPLGPGSNPQG